MTLGHIWRSPVLLLALGFGAGLSRFAPGTVGTLVAVPFVVCFAWLLPAYGYAALCIVGLLAGCGICERAANRLGVHDHPAIVWDEFVGFAIAMCFIPVTVMTVVLAFGLFRAADILKPWPANVVDARVSGGMGIMLDDVVAGIYANLVLQLITRVVL